MSTFRGRRVVLITAAAALAAGAAGVALGDGKHEPQPAPAGGTDVFPPRASHPSWSFSINGGDVIHVRSRTCPKGHPHKVGSFSFSTTHVHNDKTERRSSTGSLCAK